ncbi:hypothetical protein GAO09_17415 [Rhizobiales bacterium RZME27]|uniref:DUF3426 domain-containing protein n=1 Tax=Endobacterium cereale TaxID=2663029 RepID=A0A6A8AD48_9HYPH|nr:hypothetical protein [Endobacterium cereale]MEB2847722.1 hypothetical protein [Endobacterium cereale]MQY47817.1 hypothetical protein [Endobacterium cereale]
MSAFRSHQEGRSRQESTTAAYDILPPAPSRRPQAQSRNAQNEVVDAQFVTVGDTTQRRSFEAAPRNYNRRTDNRSPGRRPVQPAVAPTPQTGFAARLVERAEQALLRMSADFFSAIVALVFVLVFGLSGGFSLIGGGQADAAPVRDLGITHVNLTPQDANGMQAMLVTGIIENGDAIGRPLSPIRAELVSGGRVVAQTLITPPTVTIGPKESRGFSARMAYAGGKKPEVRLSFVDKGASRP